MGVFYEYCSLMVMVFVISSCILMDLVDGWNNGSSSFIFVDYGS